MAYYVIMELLFGLVINYLPTFLHTITNSQQYYIVIIK